MSDLTIAASEASVQRVFDFLLERIPIRKRLHWGGRFSADLDIDARFKRDYSTSINLTPAGNVDVRDVDVIWNRLDLRLQVDIPEICVGGQCIVPTPFGCAVRLPRVCVFRGGPEFDVTLPIGQWIRRSEISIVGKPYFFHETTSSPAEWKLFLDPSLVRFELIDIADLVGDFLTNAMNALIDRILGWIPAILRNAIRAILGPIIALIRRLLDIPDQFMEWLSRLLRVSLNCWDFIITELADIFRQQMPLHEFDDPFPIIEGDGSLGPVVVPITDMRSRVTDDEIILEADLG